MLVFAICLCFLSVCLSLNHWEPDVWSRPRPSLTFGWNLKFEQCLYLPISQQSIRWSVLHQRSDSERSSITRRNNYNQNLIMGVKWVSSWIHFQPAFLANKHVVYRLCFYYTNAYYSLPRWSVLAVFGQTLRQISHLIRLNIIITIVVIIITGTCCPVFLHVGHYVTVNNHKVLELAVIFKTIKVIQLKNIQLTRISAAKWLVACGARFSLCLRFGKEVLRAVWAWYMSAVSLIIALSCMHW